MIQQLDVITVIDTVLGTAPVSGGVSAGTYLALAALNRICDPRSKRAFGRWWAGTALGRITKIPAGALDHRRFWDAMDRVTVDAAGVDQVDDIEAALTRAMIDVFGLDTHALILDQVVLDTPSHPSKRAATCGNAMPRRSLTFRVQPRIVNYRLTAAGSKKVCGERWRVTSGPGGSTDAFECAA
ncbi:MAG TPA: hypothetical protein VHN80_05550 [Kineosporiaceae bacterium]|nr:hypothetical protein [Kineosporiaceae bacterium]